MGLSGVALNGQALPTGTQPLTLSFFGGGSVVKTGFEGGRNIAITAGLDVTVRRLWKLDPALEVRGTYPISSGTVVGEQNALVGLRLSGTVHGVHPYGDLLYGRGELNYVAPYPVNPQQTLIYSKNDSSVLSFGGGVEIGVGEHFGLRADAQLQRYASPVTTSGHLNAVPVTLGIVYRLDLDRHRIHQLQ